MLSSSYSPFSPSPFSSQLRQPRAIVTINNIPVKWTEIEVQTTTFYIADNYEVTLPLSGQSPQLDLNFWSSSVNMQVAIYFGFPINPDSYSVSDLTQFMVGNVDLLDLDPLTQTVSLSGRDLTSLLIDVKSSNKYSSMTASQIATLLANNAGLTPVITPTTGNVGTIYNNTATQITKEVTNWDLLTFLAQQSGFVTFVRGTSLYFQPFPKEDPSTAFTLQYQPPPVGGGSAMFNGTDLKFRRSLTLARDVKVVVKVPFGSKTGKAFTVTAQAARKQRPYLKNVSSFTGTPQTYTFIRAGLSQSQAQNVANQLLQNITLHEINLDASIPIEFTLQKESLIQVVGTGTSLDAFYFSDIITRRIVSSPSGIMTSQQIMAKNHSTDTELNI